MKKLIFLFFLLTACATPQMSNVEWAGEAQKISAMQELTDNAFLSELTNGKHLFAIGVASQLEGEITVIDGKCFIAQLDTENNVGVKEDCSLKAPYLVYGYFPTWRAAKINREIRKMRDLSHNITEILIENGIITEDPSALLLEATVESLDYHIVKKNGQEIPLKIQDQKVTIVGFYSKNHDGIFIQKGQKLHLHFISEDQKTSGHVKDFILKAGTKGKVYFPRKY